MNNRPVVLTRMMRLLILVVTLVAVPRFACAEFVGVTQDEFKEHYRPQKQTMWCWASSVEMVLSYHGINLPQDKIVEHVKGWSVNAPGNAFEMASATNGIVKDDQGRKVVISGQFVMGAPIPTVLYNQLKQKKPLILTYQPPKFGQPGHAVVLTGADITIDQKIGPIVTKVYIFDPFPYRINGTPWTGQTLVNDDSRIYNEYVPQTTPYGIALPTGIITGVILVDGTRI